VRSGRCLSIYTVFENLLSDQSSEPASLQFAHHIEEEFARILDYYGIPWEYEPRTFALEHDEDGRVTVAFSPDFYLPGQDLYVELTTLRPKLVTKKNRKIRRMNELYPEINVQLWKRGDLRNLMIRFGMDEHAEGLLGTDAQDVDEDE
jgi:hypoxanthine phosphoribosyltransferase